MKILKEKGAVLLKLKDPSRVTTVIPKAKTVLRQGHKIVAVPHRPDETLVLRQLGFNVPDPMPYYYNFSGRFKPFEAQVETASFLSMHPRAFCLNSMGLGKTMTSLWAYDYLRSVKQAKKLLVVCPLSTMERTWADEVFKSFPHLTFTVVYGSREKRLKLLEQDSDIYIINTDAINIIADALAKREDIDTIIIDEVAMFRNASTNRWKVMNAICNRQDIDRRVWGLTGTPIPNEPTDAWAQCKLIVPKSPDVPKYMGSFKDTVMRQISQYKWVARDNALDIVRKTMQPAIRFSLDDCIDLPEQTHIHRDAQMSPKQIKAFKEMMTKLTTEVNSGDVMAVNEAVKASKLVQIACGVVYGADHEELVIGSPDRLEVLEDIVRASEGKVLVFVPLTGVLNLVAEHLEQNWSVAKVHGDTKKTERDLIFGNFQNGTDPHVIVANPATMSHGLTLTAATTIVWYAPIYSNDIYEQACARVRRPGQKRTTVIAHIAATDFERRIYQRLAGKQKTQGTLLEMLKKLEEIY